MCSTDMSCNYYLWSAANGRALLCGGVPRDFTKAQDAKQSLVRALLFQLSAATLGACNEVGIPYRVLAAVLPAYKLLTNSQYAPFFVLSLCFPY